MSNLINKYFFSSIKIFLLLLFCFSPFLLANNTLAATSTYSWKDGNTIIESIGTGKITWQKVTLTRPTDIPEVYNVSFAINGQPPTGIGGKTIWVNNTDTSKAKLMGTSYQGNSFADITISGTQTGSTTGGSYSEEPYVKAQVVFPGKNSGGIRVKGYEYVNGEEGRSINIFPGWNPISSGISKSAYGYSGDEGKFRTETLRPGLYLFVVDEKAEFCTPGFDWVDILGPISTFCTIDNVHDWFKGEDKLVGRQVIEIQEDNTQSPDPAILEVGITKISPLTEAMASSVQWLAQFVSSGLKVSVYYIDQLLMNTKGWVLGGNMDETWTQIRNIGMTLLVLGLIIIAFANVLQIDIQRYGLNRMIPRIIVAVIMTYFSWLIVVFFFDFTQAIQKQAMGLTIANSGGLNMLGTISVVNPGTEQVIASLGMFLVTLALLVIILVSTVVLLFSLLMRVVVLSFLLAIAPLAFILMVMPFSESLYKKWWQEFWKWMFMGPMAVVIIALGTVLAAPSGASDATILDPNAITATDTLIRLLFLAAAVYFAGTLPKQWGGKIMAGWSGAGKKLWGSTGGAFGKWAYDRTAGRYVVGRTKQFLAFRKKKRDDADRLAVSNVVDKVTKSGTATGRLRNWVAGNSFNKDIAEAQRQADYLHHQDDVLKTYGIGNLGEPELKERLKRYTNGRSLDELSEHELHELADNPVAAAIWKTIATNGWTNNGGPNSGDQRMFNVLNNIDRTLANILRKGGKGRDLLAFSNDPKLRKAAGTDVLKDDIKSYGFDETSNHIKYAAEAVRHKMSLTEANKIFDELAAKIDTRPNDVTPEELEKFSMATGLKVTREVTAKEFDRLSSQGGIKFGLIEKHVLNQINGTGPELFDQSVVNWYNSNKRDIGEGAAQATGTEDTKGGTPS